MAKSTAVSLLARVLLSPSLMKNVRSPLSQSSLVYNAGFLALAVFALNFTVACAPKTSAQATPGTSSQERTVAASGSASVPVVGPTAPETALTTIVVTAPSDDKDKPECEGSTAEEAECTAIHLGLAQAELKVVFESLQKHLADDSKSRDQLTRDTAIEVKKRLDKSQRSWIQFRQADCSLESAEMLGGNREDLSLKSCLLERTRDRIRILKELAI